jgi:hypothetical protein
MTFMVQVVAVAPEVKPVLILPMCGQVPLVVLMLVTVVMPVTLGFCLV